MPRGVSPSNMSYSLIRTQAALQEYESSAAFWLSDVRGRAAAAAGQKVRADFFQARLREREAEIEGLGQMLAASEVEARLKEREAEIERVGQKLAASEAEARLKEREAEIERLGQKLAASEAEVLRLKSQLASFEQLGAKPVIVGLRGGLAQPPPSTSGAEPGSARTASTSSPSSTGRRSNPESAQARKAEIERLGRMLAASEAEACLADARLALALAKLERAGISPPFDLQHWCTANRFGAAADSLAELGVAEEADLAQVTEDELQGFLTHIEVLRFQKLAKEAKLQHEKEEVWMETVRRTRMKFLTCCCRMPRTDCCCQVALGRAVQTEEEPAEIREPVVVYPPSKDVVVFIFKHCKQPPITTTSEKPLELPDGTHQIKAEIHRKLVLDTRVTVSGGVPDTKFFNTNAVLHRLEFLLADKPSKDACVTLETDTGPVTMRTNADGIIETLLLPGQYKQRIEHLDGTIQTGNLEVVGHDHLDKDPMVKPEAVITTCTHKCSHLHLHVEKLGGPGSLVIMGDVSGSMHGTGIKMLRETFLDVYQKMGESAADVAFYTWNTALAPRGGRFKGGDFQAFSAWVANLEAGGDNELHRSLEQAMAAEPKAKSVWVLCDGDVSPFSDASWGEFVKKHSGVKFNFAAMGDDAEADAMERFAKYTGGQFSKGTWI